MENGLYCRFSCDILQNCYENWCILGIVKHTISCIMGIRKHKILYPKNNYPIRQDASEGENVS